MQKNIVIIGLTDSIINLNKIGMPIRGKIRLPLTITNQDQENEINVLLREKLIMLEDISAPPAVEYPTIPEVEPKAEDKAEDNDIINLTNPPMIEAETIILNNEWEAKVEVNDVEVDEDETEDETEDDKPKKTGRPKGSKNKRKIKVQKLPRNLAKEELLRTIKAEAQTQAMGANVVIGTLDGPKQTRMCRDAITDMSNQVPPVKEEKAEPEEKPIVIDESKLDASQQMGRKAVISTEGGPVQVDLVKSILPAGKNTDPFIDDKPEIKPVPFVDKTETEDGDGFTDAFIKI